MCKKLIVLLVVVALSVPASADYVGLANPLLVDIDGGGSVSDRTGCGWQGWQFAWDWTGPVSQGFYNPLQQYAWEQPYAQMEVYRKKKANPTAGYSRNRNGGITGVLGTGEFQATDKGFGMNYVK